MRTLQFGNLPSSSGLIASSGVGDTSSSSAIVAFDGMVRTSPHLNLYLSHNDVILGVNTDHATTMVCNHVVNNAEYVITGNIDVGGFVQRHRARSHIFQHTRGPCFHPCQLTTKIGDFTHQQVTMCL